MKYLTRLLIFFLLGTYFLTSCTKYDDLEIGDHAAEYALPLFSSDISLQDIVSNRVDNTTLTVDTDGQLTLNYKGALLTKGASDIFSFTAAFLPIRVTDTVFNVSNEDFEIPGSIDIDFLDLKTGQITIQYQSDIPEDIMVNMTIPQFVKDGVSYTKSFSSTYDDSLPIMGGIAGENLAGYRIIGGDPLITVLYDAILPDGTKVVLPSFVVVLTNLEYGYAEGFLGNDVYDIGKDTIEIDFFDTWEQGIVNFEDPKIILSATNSFGFPLDANFFGIDIIGIEGERLSLQSDAINEGIGLGFPSLTQVGETVETSFTFDKDNSNIRDILAVGPSAVEYELDGEPNPNLDPNSRGFMTDSSRINVQMEVELPLNGYTFGFALRDTFDIDLANFENVNAAEFKLITENEVPLALKLEVSFADENFNVIDVLTIQDENQYIGAAPVDDNGFVIGVNSKEIIESFDATRFAKIRNAKKILIRTAFNTTNSDILQLVKFNASQSVKSRMGLKVEVLN